jgi:hypothetical protein
MISLQRAAAPMNACWYCAAISSTPSAVVNSLVTTGQSGVGARVGLGTGADVCNFVIASKNRRRRCHCKLRTIPWSVGTVQKCGRAAVSEIETIFL